MEKTLGGDRLGSGKKMKVHLHGYERSTHDIGYLWRSTMAAGTLVPFLVEVALPGDTFDINLDIDIKTHPTIGPLFGSYKIQADVFQAPVRLYQGDLHNNKLGIGMNMAAIKLPVMNIAAAPITLPIPTTTDLDNLQINPSCLLAYLGVRGVGIVPEPETFKTRSFNGIPLLAYWDIYKNYYSNKQEEIGAALNTPGTAQDVTTVTAGGSPIDEYPATGLEVVAIGEDIIINFVGTAPSTDDIIFGYTSPVDGSTLEDSATTLLANIVIGGATITGDWNSPSQGIEYWKYASAEQRSPVVATFPLANIDEMRERIMQATGSGVALSIGGQDLTPYSYVLSTLGAPISRLLETQQGLGLKTYQSDLFNNWLQTEWIDGAGGITEVTAIDTSGGSFTIDTLNLSRKVYDMLNRIAVSGGTYDDWLDAVYTHDRYTRCESPMYMGGLIKELVFQEVVSNADSEGQPLGTLAGRGVMGKKHKGGKITVKVDEPSYIIGIISLTPRVDYSQGNKWDMHLQTMDDFHKPALDEIGFQELLTEQMAYWTTIYDTPGAEFVQLSAGKQPAWLNYMTNVNRVYGNFAIETNEMFMTLNRRYENDTSAAMTDLTTYIDPVKFNHIFAQTSRDAQNFWTQIAVDMTARRKMSAKLMPNL